MDDREQYVADLDLGALVLERANGRSHQQPTERLTGADRDPVIEPTSPLRARVVPAHNDPCVRTLELTHNLLADLVRIGIDVAQDPRRHACVLAYQAKQDVRRGDGVASQGQRLAHRELEHPLSISVERNLGWGGFLAETDDSHNLRADALCRQLERLQHPRSVAFVLTERAEQDVLGADRMVLELARRLRGLDEDPAGSLCEGFCEEFVVQSRSIAPPRDPRKHAKTRRDRRVRVTLDARHLNGRSDAAC